MARPARQSLIRESPAVVAGMVEVSRDWAERWCPDFRKDLTYRVSDGANFGGGTATYTDLPAYQEQGSTILLPRHYFSQIAAPHVVDDQTAKGAAIKVQFTKTLFDTETRNQVAAANALIRTDGGSIAVRTGFGKSYTSIFAALKRGRRTLIVVPTTVLLGQWIQAIQECTDLKREDIGVVQGPACQWNKPFIVGMVQSLYESERPFGLYDSVGTVIYDEMHRMSAPSFVQAVPRFPARVRWGLSATPTRKDGLHRLFENHVGPVVYQYLGQELRATVWAVRTNIELNQSSYHNRWNGQLNQSKLLNALSEHEGRNRLLARHIAQAHKAGRKILVTSRRNEQFITLRQMLENMAIPANRMGVIVGEGRVTNDVMQRRLRVLRDARIIFANESIAGLGMDEPSLNMLVMALPSQSVDQLCGRITRAYEGKNDYSPVVLDPVDLEPILESMFNRRRRAYKKLGYQIKFGSL